MTVVSMSSQRKKNMKVAHIFKALNPGGIESWLKDLSYFDEHQLHYLVQDNTRGFYDEEVLNNKVKLVKTPFDKGLFSYSFYIFKYFKSNDIDVVHSHVNLSSGWILFIAFLAGVKKRVAHCHNDKRSEYQKANFVRKAYYFLMKIFVDVFSNIKISVSVDAAPSMFYKNRNYEVIPCGLSFGRAGELIRDDFNLSENDIVITHVGRFVNQKNHAFIIDLAESLRNERVKFLLVGQGDLQTEIKDLVKSKGLEDIVTFLNIRSDINNILYDLSDFFILPSKFEGLGLAAVESQSNNVYTLVSDRVPLEVKISSYIDFLPIQTVECWAQRIKFLISSSEYKNAKKSSFDNYKFSIENNVKNINGAYIK